MKTCAKCKKEKRVIKFHNNKRMKDGYSRICKECSHERYLKYAQEAQMPPDKLAELKSKYNPDGL